MFSLRSSPSTLVCDLRDGWASTSTTAAVHLSAPRPHRPSVMFGFDVSYDGNGSGGRSTGVTSGGDGASLGGSSARGAFSPAVSDYAGVFEAGFDPAQVRASMTKKVVEVETTAPQTARGEDLLVEPHSSIRPGAASCREGTGSRGWPDLDGALEAGTFVDDDDDVEEIEDGFLEDDAIDRNDQEEEEAEFLFEMEGLKEPPRLPLPSSCGEVAREENDGRWRAGGAADDQRRWSSGGRGGNGGWVAAAAAAGVVAATAAAAAAAAAGSQRSGSSRSGGLHDTEAQQGSTAMTSASAAGGVREGGGAYTAAGGSVLNKSAVLRKPRVIAPRGTRCLGGGMYRLRLSTSC